MFIIFTPPLCMYQVKSCGSNPGPFADRAYTRSTTELPSQVISPTTFNLKTTTVTCINILLMIDVLPNNVGFQGIKQLPEKTKHYRYCVTSV